MNPAVAKIFVRGRVSSEFQRRVKFREASKVTTLLRIERRSHKLAGILFSLCARTRLLACLLEGIIAVLLSGERNFGAKVAPKPAKILT